MLQRWPWVVAPPWPDHLFPMAEGLCCPVCGRTKLRGAPRMDEHRANERLAGRTRFFLFSLPFLLSFCCLLSDRWCAREILFVLFSLLILSCPPRSCCLNLDDRIERWSQSRRPTLTFASCNSTPNSNYLQFHLLSMIIPFLLEFEQLAAQLSHLSISQYCVLCFFP